MSAAERETILRARVAQLETEAEASARLCAELRAEADRLEGERNAMKKKAAGVRRDMARIFRACGGKSIRDVEALVRERRELQVGIKMHKADRDAAVDELRAYKDALQRQLVEGAKGKKRSLRERLRKRAGLDKGGKSGDGENGGGAREGFSVEELQNLTFQLMDQVEERDERMRLKEFEKRELFDRIIALEAKMSLMTKVEVEEGEEAKGDGEEGEEEDSAAEAAAAAGNALGSS